MGDQGIPVLLTLGGTVGGLHPPYLCRGPGVVSILLSPGNCVSSLPVGNPTCVCPPRPREVSIPFPFRGPGGLHPPYLWGNRSGPCPPLLWEVRGSLHPPPLMRGGQGSPHPLPLLGNWGDLRLHPMWGGQRVSIVLLFRETGVVSVLLPFGGAGVSPSSFPLGDSGRSPSSSPRGKATGRSPLSSPCGGPGV